jgi:hypothetical protein
LRPAGADIPGNIGVNELDLRRHFQLGYWGFGYIDATDSIVTKKPRLMVSAQLGNGLEAGYVDLITIPTHLVILL